ncbi:MAG: BlaI/MecI/CopY family transcriptional regulator [Candidatus Hadarchaeales archaeon]
MSLFEWSGYKPHKQGLETVLSPLEAEIMEIMWKEKSATARTVYARLRSKHNICRPSVNAVMSSLCKRGLLSARISRGGRGGLKYVYKPKISRRRFEREVVGKVLDSLLQSFEKTTRKLIDEKLKGCEGGRSGGDLGREVPPEKVGRDSGAGRDRQQA